MFIKNMSNREKYIALATILFIAAALLYAFIIDPDKGTLEKDTFTCAHCNKVWHLEPFKPPEDQAAFCRRCYSLVCQECSTECTPYEKRVEQWEKIGNMILERGK